MVTASRVARRSVSSGECPRPHLTRSSHTNYLLRGGSKFDDNGGRTNDTAILRPDRQLTTGRRIWSRVTPRRRE